MDSLTFVQLEDVSTAKSMKLNKFNNFSLSIFLIIAKTTHLKYSDAADEYLTYSVVFCDSDVLLNVPLLAVVLTISNCTNDGKIAINFVSLDESPKTNENELTGLQFAVFQMLPHEVHGRSLVKDAKKNRNDHAIITL